MIKQKINAENGEVELIEMSPDEEMSFLAEVAETERRNEELELERIESESAALAAYEAESAAKESARAKLAALGLTEEEVAALIK